jgi:hypothetical protein
MGNDSWWPHFLHLLLHVWDLVKVWQSATTFSLLKEALIFRSVVFLVAARITLGQGWYKPSVFKSKGHELLKSLRIASLSSLTLLVVVFLSALPVAIYRDHQELVWSNSKLVPENLLMQTEIQALAETLQHKSLKAPIAQPIRPSWQRLAGPQTGPFGPIFAVELTESF